MGDRNHPKHSSMHETKSTPIHHDGVQNTEVVQHHELNPTGVVAIHIKKCRNLKILDAAAKGFSKRFSVNIYLKIMVGEVTKMTSVAEVRCANNIGTVFDDLKYFTITVQNKLDHESNKVKFILMGYQGTDKHKRLGEKEIHLFNIIKNLFIVETLELTKNAHVVGEFDTEVAFSYGCFGYGYSTQLESKTHTPTDVIAQSLFFRAEPPSDRRHESKDVMTAIPILHPPFINWPVQTDVITTGKEYMSDSVTALLSGRKKSNQDYPLLINKMNKRMPDLQKKYSALNKRSERLTFLQNLVTTRINPELEESQNEILFNTNDGLENKKSGVDPDQGNDAADDDEAAPGFFTRVLEFFGLGGASRGSIYDNPKPPQLITDWKDNDKQAKPALAVVKASGISVRTRDPLS